jgi:hypothetical protein
VIGRRALFVNAHRDRVAAVGTPAFVLPAGEGSQIIVGGSAPEDGDDKRRWR